MKWYVLYENFNNRKIESLNILQHCEEKIKELKKRNSNYDNFCEELSREMKWRYWSRCEYELVLTVTDSGKIVLKPWVGLSDSVYVEDVYTEAFNWQDFAKNYCGIANSGETKIDVYDQLKYRWDDFCKYCWRKV